MSEVPSSYLIDKALKAKASAALDAAHEGISNRHEIESSLVEALSQPEAAEKGVEMAALDEQTVQERAEMAGDVTLTDLEKKLTAKQLKFAWNLAKQKVSGQKLNLTQCALDEQVIKRVKYPAEFKAEV